MIVTIYYLIPGLRELFSFPLFLAGSGILLVGGGWVLGKILVKRPATRDVTKFSPPGETKDGRGDTPVCYCPTATFDVSTT